MASGYPPDDKTPQYCPYPAPSYSAPGYQSMPSSQPINDPSAAVPTAPNVNTVSASIEDRDDSRSRDRSESTTSYDDVFKLSKPVEITFQEVFREAKGSESPEAIVQINKTIFNYTAYGIYVFLSVLVGAILSVVWGIVFGVVNFVVTWLAQPALKIMFMLLRIAANAFGPVWRAFLDPFFQSWGHIFSKIRGAFNFNVHGIVFPKKEKRQALTHEA